MRSLLVTNDFPPKIGGIQNYLWELWRRLDPADNAVYCTPHSGAVMFDAQQDFRIERSPEPVLLPYPWLIDRIRRFADEVEADLILLDPAVPLGLIGPSLGRPYGVILHGAEVTIPGRLPGAKQALRRVLVGASLVIAAGQYALTEAQRCAGQPLPSVVIPPGVDTERFRPPSPIERAQARARFRAGPDDPLVACVTRLVPRKGMHTLVSASARLVAEFPRHRVVIGGDGRQLGRLQRLASDQEAPVELVGRLSDQDVVELYRAADLMVMPCATRWSGLEQEGFGIVFLEAAASGVPQVAGRSGGAAEAVEQGVSGLIVDRPDDPAAVAEAMSALLADPVRREMMGTAGRQRAVDHFSYDHLANRLSTALQESAIQRRP